MKILFSILLLFGAVGCYAQPFSTDEKIKPTELKLTSYVGKAAKEKGRIAIVDVNQKDESLYFFVRGISIFSPIMIYIESEDKANRLGISLHKDFWKDADKSGNTDNNGVFSTSFKTAGDFGIKILSKKMPAKYQILVWVGDEVTPDLPSPFKKQKAAQ
ncbi:MAG: hypothetical protein ACKVQJ_12750 [Pyrinomonadaceae bacterium]